MTERMTLPALVRTSRIVAIVRGGAPENTLPACETLIRSGIACLEVTTNTPGWQATIASLAARDDVLVGAGTVRTAAQAEAASDAGASFVVAPDTNPAVAQAARARGMGWYPGALTPTEIAAAWDAGATAVKVFPASAVGGPSYLKAVRAPLDDVVLMPTGGVGLADARSYIDAGAVALGLGSPLIGDALDGGSLDELAARARAFAEAVATDA